MSAPYVPSDLDLGDDSTRLRLKIKERQPPNLPGFHSLCQNQPSARTFAENHGLIPSTPSTPWVLAGHLGEMEAAVRGGGGADHSAE